MVSKKDYEVKVYVFDHHNNYCLKIIEGEMVKAIGLGTVLRFLKEEFFEDDIREYSYEKEIYEFDRIEVREVGEEEWNEVLDFKDVDKKATRKPSEGKGRGFWES